MKALSIRQPWAWLIVNGYKDIENRTWSTSYRGRIYIHASKTFDPSWLDDPIASQYAEAKGSVRTEAFGAIIGEVTIVDCCAGHPSKWYRGPYGFVLKNPVAYKSPIPYKGQLGLFNIALPTQRQRVRGTGR